jgi:hypothetical protein
MLEPAVTKFWGGYSCSPSRGWTGTNSKSSVTIHRQTTGEQDLIGSEAVDDVDPDAIVERAEFLPLRGYGQARGV